LIKTIDEMSRGCKYAYKNKLIFLYNGSLSSLNERVAGSRTAGINDKEKPDFITR